ncbi:tRNA (adenosine(37)-N6)-threonylcarbamoyltransferase complex ATPase subunit type 1 TsaE [Campylobacter sp. FMV-PI01]|uniref:tRNA threonylcarbamoyladenosine biosynthesis protein TsaE n=1 Tax=Campylobacter portucalensis TaxID=2608384 RepID=A0A6L5WI08_9BACT|nr:tRNA (adenosine(37)-N6)-threonylcarbamoyltransferase complex ATPase subunit type 1 TsaE [Campylobacter portucalensis]MSN96759.1 tRNA (adenosine(37)-N6)-threonylcarbamoyltransferase complex ATPase subunit type 1 TsaE [Campylobacter portucalensis]
MILGLNELSKIVEILPKDGIILLKGNLASGKTTLVKEIAKIYGFNQNICSPTFSIMQNYDKIYHYDIYQYGSERILQNGLFENLFEDGLHLIEWADEGLERMLKKFNLPYCTVEIEILNNKRNYKVTYA